MAWFWQHSELCCHPAAVKAHMTSCCGGSTVLSAVESLSQMNHDAALLFLLFRIAITAEFCSVQLFTSCRRASRYNRNSLVLIHPPYGVLSYVCCTSKVVFSCRPASARVQVKSCSGQRGYAVARSHSSFSHRGNSSWH